MREDEHFCFCGSCGLVAGCCDIPLYLSDYFCLIRYRSMFILQVFILERALFTRLFLCDTHIWRCLLCRDLTFLPAHTTHTSQLGQVGGPFAPRSPPASPRPSLGQLGQSTVTLQNVSSQRVSKGSQSAVPTTLHVRGRMLCPSHLRHLGHSTAEAPSSSPGPRSPSHGGHRSAGASPHVGAARAQIPLQFFLISMLRCWTSR